MSRLFWRQRGGLREWSAPRGAEERELLISASGSGTSVRVYVTTARFSKSMDKTAAGWLLWEPLTEASVAAT